MLTDIKHQQPYNYTTTKSTMPYAYGSSTFRVLLSRAFYLLNGIAPNQAPIQQRFIEWADTNKHAILSAFKNNLTHTVIIQLPFQTIFLSDAIEQKYIKINKTSNSDLIINIHYYKTEYININSFAKDFAREIWLTLLVGLTKTVLDNFDLVRNFQSALACAFILGLVKGAVKSTSDILETKKSFIASMPLKCALDVFAEIITVIAIQITGLEWYAAPKCALRGFLKYILKHLALGISILMTKTELTLEMFKASLKGFLRAYFRAVLISLMPSVGQILGPMFGSILGVLLINVFIDQCSLST